ncbi:hypothetical protein P8452_64744 [Trifolium repens]|nr:hypothetical protein P8452_64744 [Trifolium repens]
MLLQPSNTLEDYCRFLKLNIDDSQPLQYYLCNKRRFPCEYSDVLSTSRTCSDCWFMNKNLVASPEKQFCDGFVNDGATFVITDDLRVFPNSMDITSFSMLKSFGIKHTSSVKKITVNVTKEKVLDMLKCCLVSKSTLTDIFLGMKPNHGWLSRIFCCDIEKTNDIQITMKLVIRKSDGKILYAEGDRDFADFLISFLTFPLGGVVHMFGGNCSLGSVDALYNSILDLDENKYFVRNEAKNRIVDPHLAPQFELNHILPIHTKTVFVERSCDTFVKGPRTYVATDDLVLTESSPASVLNLINHFQTPFDDLNERVIKIGVHECLSILKASLTSTSALTNGLGHLVTEVQEGKMRSINIC